MLYILAIILSVIVDQAVKAFVTAHLELHASMPLIPHVVELLYVRNTGGGFSILTDHTWLLTVFTVVLLTGVALLLWKDIFPHPLARWTLTLVLGGGLGNLIDRVRLGYVVDMFHLEFFPSYPVFNVADMLVVVGVLGFAAYYVLLYGKSSGKGKTDQGASPRNTEVGDGTDDPASGT